MKTEYLRYIISSDLALIDALKVLNDTGKRIVFLVDDGILKGVLTYGDVSRWILKGNSLEAPAYKAATTSPIVVRSVNHNEVEDLFKKNISALPVVGEGGYLLEILFEDEYQRHYEEIDIPVVIMAGGKGTRLYPYTKILPKPLIPIGEIPISEHIVNRFVLNGCRDFYFIVNYKKNMIKAYFNEIEKEYDVHFVDEDTPLGTGGGISLVRNLVHSTFILTNCDSFIDEDYAQILEAHRSMNNKVTMICSNLKYEVPYGVVKTNSDNSFIGIQEKPSFTYLTNTGTYIVEPDVIDKIAPGEFIGFPDVIQRVKDDGGNVGVFVVDERSWLDMGQFDTMDEMKKRLNIKD